MDGRPLLWKAAFRTITFDNGVEFSRWREMEDALGIKTYFARPYHSADRGSNENCNGLVRRFVRKGADIGTIPLHVTRSINAQINGKHRRILGYRTAEDMMREELTKLGIFDTKQDINNCLTSFYN